jgi:uncharacterized protein YndB with AHSA1/START domain
MTEETMNASITINAPAHVVFDILADPTTHAAIDGTGWVRESLDGKPLTESGQIFRMAMYHDNHPNGSYEMANKVQAFDPPNAISWEPGQDSEDEEELTFGGWVWRYDLTPGGPSATEVRLTYDWSAVPQPLREHIGFPPFGREHLDNSLRHLAEIATRTTARN